MNTSKLKYVHFIGCGGAGTQPLAMIFHELGYVCSGSDIIANRLTKALEKAGVKVFSGHSAENLPPGNAEDSLVVYTSAATKDNPELVEAEKRGIPRMRRGEALAMLAKHFPLTVAVAGSHGKTSVTSMIAFALKKLGYEPGFLIGGRICGNDVSGTAGGGRIFVSEVDESDSTNALFAASVGVVTNVEDDHCWSVGGVDALYASFTAFAEKAGYLVYVSGSAADTLFSAFGDKADVVEKDFRIHGFPGTWGGYQQINAATAFRALKKICPEKTDEELVSALAEFLGVERRMCLRFDGACRVIEDYAHHPTEVAAALSAIRETNPGRRLVVIFQPHRYARLKRYLNDFAKILSDADRVFVVPVFAAWTDSSDVTSGTLAGRIGAKASAVAGGWDEIAGIVLKEVSAGDVVAVIGAGDVNLIIPFLSGAAAKA